MVFAPLRVGEAGEIEAVRGAAIDRRRAEASDWGETVNVGSRADQVVRDVEHDYFADDESVGADRLGAVEFALKADLGFGEARSGDVDGRRGVQAGGGQLTFIGRKIGGRDIHGVEQVDGHHVHYELAGGADVGGGVFWFTGVATPDAEDDVEGVGADRVEETEGGQIDCAGGVQGCDPGDWPRDHKVGDQLVVVGFRVERWIDLHEVPVCPVYRRGKF